MFRMLKSLSMKNLRKVFWSFKKFFCNCDAFLSSSSLFTLLASKDLRGRDNWEAKGDFFAKLRRILFYSEKKRL